MEAILQLEGLTVSWTQLDRVLLPARVPGYHGEDLDMLAATGRLVWLGQGAAGPKDGRIALYRRERVSGLFQPAPDTEPLDGLHAVLLGHLRERGACFLMELAQAAERAGLEVRRDDFEAALWDLVWSGHITNDTFAPLRGLAGGARWRRRGREPAVAGGRWSCVRDLLRETSDTERLLARAEMLLERYGVLSREAAQAEGLAGGFGSIYRLLRDMEEGGKVRRGYFVEGLSGAQFALAGAVDRLRGARLDEVPVGGWSSDEVRILAAVDPANPFGALLPWPETGGGSAPKRNSGAWVVLVAGRPVLFLGPGGGQLATFPACITEEGGELDLALSALPAIPRTGRRRMLIRKIDGLSALESPLRERLLRVGFESDYDALRCGIPR
jgi:ATP-dependent Lhr-like helicase